MRILCLMAYLFSFILVNVERRRVLSCMSPSGLRPDDAKQQQLSVARKLDVIRTFYRNTVGPVFQDNFVHSPHALDANGGEVLGYFFMKFKDTMHWIQG